MNVLVVLILAIVMAACSDSEDKKEDVPTEHPAKEFEANHPFPDRHNQDCTAESVTDTKTACPTGQFVQYCGCTSPDPSKPPNTTDGLKTNCRTVAEFESACSTSDYDDDKFCETEGEKLFGECRNEPYDRCICVVDPGPGEDPGTLRWNCLVGNAQSSWINVCPNLGQPDRCDPACGDDEICDECAQSSCDGCNDCIAACVPGIAPECVSELEITCDTPKPDCQAIIKDGCWECLPSGC